jgi:hypothetical protein
VRVFATKWFTRFARSEGISDERLCEAIVRAEQGSVDADLGGNLIKQRVARAGGGRSGGYRTMIAYQSARRSVFLYGFATSERDNIDPKRLAELKILARRFASLSDAEIQNLLHAHDVRELDYHGQEQED